MTSRWGRPAPGGPETQAVGLPVSGCCPGSMAWGHPIMWGGGSHTQLLPPGSGEVLLASQPLTCLWASTSGYSRKGHFTWFLGKAPPFQWEGSKMMNKFPFLISKQYPQLQLTHLEPTSPPPRRTPPIRCLKVGQKLSPIK